MTWQTYGSFVLFAAVLILVPGPDFAVVARNALTAGRRCGAWAAAGVASSNAVQGALAVIGLVFYLAVLPQFPPARAPVWQLAALGLTHAVIGLGYSLLVVAGLHRVRAVLARRPVRRALDAATGVAMVGFGAVLAREQLARAA